MKCRCRTPNCDPPDVRSPAAAMGRCCSKLLGAASSRSNPSVAVALLDSRSRQHGGETAHSDQQMKRGRSELSFVDAGSGEDR